MDINFDNTFLLIIKISLGIFTGRLQNVYERIYELSASNIERFLERPMVSKLIASSIFALLFGLTCLSFIVLISVACVLCVIILIEGLILSIILILVIASTILSTGVVIIVYGLKSTWQRKML